MTDSYRHKGMRRRLIAALREKGIADEPLLAAMGELPRHFFMEKGFDDHAYDDKAFPIAAGQTISQPYTVAYMTELLQVKKGDRVLEIGTGSGYQAALLSMLGASVYTVERQEVLFHQTRKLLDELGFRAVRTFLRDGSNGLSEFAPFSKIIVTAGAPVVPDALKKQLAVGGRLVIPIGEKEQNMMLIERTGDATFSEKQLDTFRFVPFLAGIEGRKV